MPFPTRCDSVFGMLRPKQRITNEATRYVVTMLASTWLLSTVGCARAVSDRGVNASPLTVAAAPGTTVVLPPLIVRYERAGPNAKPVNPLPDEAQITAQIVRRIQNELTARGL